MADSASGLADVDECERGLGIARQVGRGHRAVHCVKDHRSCA